MRVYPKIVLKDQKTLIKITNSKECILKEGETYILRHTAVEMYSDIKTDGSISGMKGFEISDATNDPLDKGVVATNQGVSAEFLFEEEQEHCIRIYLKDTMEKIGHVNLYALEEDLYKLRPYKGDLHLHSNRSDGMETPAKVVSECRKVGFDFMALTDHLDYNASIESQESYKGFGGMLEIYRGEEIHLPHNKVHLLSINANASVNECFLEDKDRYFKEVEEIEKTIDKAPKKSDKYMLASSKWAFDKIKEYGGMSVYCHPYWRREAGYNNSTALTDAILERQEFDVFEVISGYDHEEADSNLLQVAKYHEVKEKGQKLPLIGVSDAHDIMSRVRFGRFYTIVLAKSPEFKDVRNAIMSYKNVAIEHLEGEQLRAHGDYRLVKYALFLTHEFFPEHDLIAKEESKLMEMYISDKGGCGFEKELEQIKSKMESYYKRCGYKL